MENKLDCLTSLRFFAAAQVVCFHFGRAAFPRFANQNPAGRTGKMIQLGVEGL